MTDDFIENLRALTDNIDDVSFSRYVTVINVNNDGTADVEEDNGVVHKNVLNGAGFKLNIGDDVILCFIDNDIYNPVIFANTNDTVNNLLSSYALKSELFNKDYNELNNKPVIPSKTSELVNDDGFLKEHQSLSEYYTKTEVDNGLSEGLHDLNENIRESINQTNNLIDEVSGSTLNIEKTLYKGEGGSYNPNATPSNPTQGTVLPVLSQTKNDLTSTQHTVNNVQSKVNMFGDTLNELLTPVTNGGKEGLILVYYKDNSSSFNSNELLDLQNNYNININDIKYALCTSIDPTQVKWYKKEDNVWSEDPDASALLHSEVTLMPLLGISYELTRTEMFPNPTNVCMNFKYIYVPAIRKYYKFIGV